MLAPLINNVQVHAAIFDNSIVKPQPTVVSDHGVLVKHVIKIIIAAVIAVIQIFAVKKITANPQARVQF